MLIRKRYHTQSGELDLCDTHPVKPLVGSAISIFTMIEFYKKRTYVLRQNVNAIKFIH